MIDGMNRYYALVRLIFLYYNYSQQEKMENLFAEVEPLLESGNFYSKRILINYYGNRLLFHSKANQLDLAEKYGYLSIRAKNSDYLHYVNNLNTVLLKKGQIKQALSIMRQAFPEANKSPNFHHRVSFVASYARCLTDSGEIAKAITHAEIFLNAFKKELMEHRWHFFFTIYFRALFLNGQYRKINQVIIKFRLIEKEEKYLEKIKSVATLEWYNIVAFYKTEKIELDELRVFVKDFLKIYDTISNRSKAVNELLVDTKKIIPELL
jgi:tetratricopeptide (TPR) repeat protein